MLPKVYNIAETYIPWTQHPKTSQVSFISEYSAFFIDVGSKVLRKINDRIYE